jgi:hypothetical protein
MVLVTTTLGPNQASVRPDCYPLGRRCHDAITRDRPGDFAQAIRQFEEGADVAAAYGNLTPDQPDQPDRRTTAMDEAIRAHEYDFVSALLSLGVALGYGDPRIASLIMDRSVRATECDATPVATAPAGAER